MTGPVDLSHRELRAGAEALFAGPRHEGAVSLGGDGALHLERANTAIAREVWAGR